MSPRPHPLDANWRILITGTTSIHGWPVYRILQKNLPSHKLYGIRPPKMKQPSGPGTMALCITARKELEKIKSDFHPTHVVHCAGVCDLDVCEERPDWAMRLNRDGASNIREVFSADAYICYLSTDLVFSGNNPPSGGYAEKHNPDPVSVAGKTFSLAEREIRRARRWCIVRLGLPLGDSITGDKGAIDWVESRFKRNLPVTLFHDEYRSCISCKKIAETIFLLLRHEITGLWHLGGKTPLSLYEVGKLVLQRNNYPPHLLSTRSRHQDPEGPPRIGDVSLNSQRLEQLCRQLQCG